MLFVDVEASTDLLSLVGDESGNAAIDRALDAARERIETYDGQLVKELGDGLLATFPSPRDAVAFATATQQAAPVRPRLKIGMDFGPVTPGDPRGGAANAAARITGRAAGGEILVSEVVARLAASTPGVRFVDRGRVTLKGFYQRWQLYAVVAATDVEPAAPVFGRNAELATVDSLIGSVSLGTGRGLLLEGEAGIGKSHLASEAMARARSAGMVVVRGTADELEQDRPGRIVSELVSRLGVSFEDLALGSDEPAAAGATDPGFAVVDRFVDLLENHAAARAVLLVAEDLHWADDLSLRVLGALIRRIGPLSAGVIATMRPSPRGPALHRFLEIAGRAPVDTVKLDGLTPAAIAGLVASITGGAPGVGLERRLDSAAGNPLFVTELIRALDDEGALRIENGVTEATRSELPAGLVETLSRRVETIPPDAIEMLRLAALLGGRFTLDDLAAVSGRSLVDTASDLRVAVDAALLVGHGNELAFRHDLIREAVYLRIDPAIRRDLHLAAGRALAGAGRSAPQVAKHFAIGGRPGDLVAVDWLLRASDAARRIDTAAAVQYAEQALGLAPPEWPDRHRLECDLVELLAWAGRASEANALATSLLDRSLNPVEEMGARRSLASMYSTVGELGAAGRQLETAAALDGIERRHRDVLELAAAGMAVIAGTAPPATAEECGQRHVQSNDIAVACWAHNTLAVAAIADGRYDDCAEHARIACRLLERDYVAPLGFLIPQTWLPSAYVNLDDIDQAASAADDARHLGERRGDVGLVLHALACQVGVAAVISGWEDADVLLDTAFRLSEETSVGVHALFFHGNAAQMAIGRGDHPTASQHVQRGQEVWAAGGVHPFGLDMLLFAQAQLHEIAGELDEARALLGAVWDQTENLRGLVQWRSIAPPLADLARRAGDTERAAAVAAACEEIAGRSSSRSAAATARRVRALADSDADLAVRAADDLDAAGHLTEAARAREEAARLLLAADRSPEAVEVLDRAGDFHMRTGATGNLARIDGLLRDAGQRRRRSGPAKATTGWEALSPKEHEVVTLVSEGLSNPQIAERLYISRRTVESHLSHVFTKLQLANRTQLATAAIEYGQG